jgi:translation initiation factor 1
MSRPRQRIPVNGPQGGLPGAFAGLHVDGLTSSDNESQEQLSPEKAERDGGESGRSRSKGRVILRRLTAHRGGKVVIAIDGFDTHHTEADIEAFARRLRAHCGCGGTVSGRVVELQGDQVFRIRAFLEAEGFRVSGEK